MVPCFLTTQPILQSMGSVEFGQLSKFVEVRLTQPYAAVLALQTSSVSAAPVTAPVKAPFTAQLQPQSVQRWRAGEAHCSCCCWLVWRSDWSGLPGAWSAPPGAWSALPEASSGLRRAGFPSGQAPLCPWWRETWWCWIHRGKGGPG